MKWEIVEPAEVCGVRRSPRSSATCELSPGHQRNPYLAHHCGRVASGHWKLWPTIEQLEALASSGDTTGNQTNPESKEAHPKAGS